jgi:acyl carrier protein phosphodiesterase
LNYLGHAYFSYNHPEILVGNLISDFVKGKKKFDYPPDIQKGIQLHREMDVFTDTHPATQRAKEVFRPHYRLYASAFVDVVYDYFIANDPAIFNKTSLMDFTQITYEYLTQKQNWFPEKFALLFPYMKSQNWLFNYRYTWGIEKSFAGLARRASYIIETETAFLLFENHLDLLARCYEDFNRVIKKFARERFNDLLKTEGI